MYVNELHCVFLHHKSKQMKSNQRTVDPENRELISLSNPLVTVGEFATSLISCFLVTGLTQAESTPFPWSSSFLPKGPA